MAQSRTAEEDEERTVDLHYDVFFVYSIKAVRWKTDGTQRWKRDIIGACSAIQDPVRQPLKTHSANSSLTGL